MHARIVTGCVGMIAKHFSCPDNIREGHEHRQSLSIALHAATVIREFHVHSSLDPAPVFTNRRTHVRGLLK